MTPIVENCLLAFCAGVASVGYGSGLAWFLRIRPNLGDHGILGLLVVGFLGCILHFAVALSTLVQAIVLAGGVMIAIASWRDTRSHASLGLAAVAGLCIFVLLHRQAQGNYDLGLYYLQAFEWNRQFPVVAGLGNLHGRLAFNSILFLIAPLTDRIESGWVTNLLVTTFVMLSLWSRLRQLDASDHRDRTQYWFLALAILVVVLRSSGLGILTADAIVVMLVVYWVALALGLSRAEDQRTVFALLTTSAVLAAVVKISTAPLVILTMVLYWFHRKEESLGAARVWAFAGVVLTAWILHGVFLSGCAVYPVSPTCFPELPWAVSLQQAADEAMAIKAWARQPFEADFARVLQDWSWFLPWLKKASNYRVMAFLLVGIALGAAALVFAGAKSERQSRDLVVASAGLAVCVAFWFWSAPDVRFGLGFILAASLVGFSVAARRGCINRSFIRTHLES